MPYPAPIEAALNGLCKSALAGHLELDLAASKFVGMLARASIILDEKYDLNNADQIFIRRLNEIATDRETTEALIRACAQKAIAKGVDPKDILHMAIQESRNILPGPRVREILREEWQAARPAPSSLEVAAA